MVRVLLLVLLLLDGCTTARNGGVAFPRCLFHCHASVVVHQPAPVATDVPANK